MIRSVVWINREFALRLAFCWGLGLIFPIFDEVHRYDSRFKMRGPQPVSSEIVIVNFDQHDWTTWHGQNTNLIRALKEFAPASDSFFWQGDTWNLLLGEILRHKPKGIGVTFFFGPFLTKPEWRFKTLKDPKVFWAGQIDNEGRAALPLLASPFAQNVALVDFQEDEDRVLRRYASSHPALAHMATRLSEKSVHKQELSTTPAQNDPPDEERLQSFTINFRGPKSVYRHISAVDVRLGNFSPDFFKDKIVIIGTNSILNHQYQTPLGSMSRAEIIAQVVDQIIELRHIDRLPYWGSALYLLLILLIAVSILRIYPQSIALVFLFWLGLGTTALSIWIFDSFNFWIPAFSPLLQILITYIVLIGYQLSMKENQTWRLEQEKKILSELDQLRNNFVSLISHDLKTPIAKIQAICDRLLSLPDQNVETKAGLKNLRKESMELNRYIQSVLKISRLESNPVQMHKEPVDLNELVAQAVDQLRPLAEDKRQVLKLELEPLFSIEVDSILIHEVVLNLIENAIKYTQNDGIIQIQTQEVDDKILFSVTDNGPGINRLDQGRLFEKFFRGEAQGSTIKGTGLGLYLVKYFIELHGGEVFLESDPGRGTRIGFTLPI